VCKFDEPSTSSTIINQETRCFLLCEARRADRPEGQLPRHHDEPPARNAARILVQAQLPHNVAHGAPPMDTNDLLSKVLILLAAAEVIVISI
jgi:hypothetical protein